MPGSPPEDRLAGLKARPHAGTPVQSAVDGGQPRAADRLSRLTARPKFVPPANDPTADAAARRHGYEDRTPRKKPGRKPSPRTGQLHPKVMPDISAAIAAEAERLAVTQGVLVELMWTAYQREQERAHD